MKLIKNPRILIMGAQGMLGRAVYYYFKTKYPDSIWGTASSSRNKPFFKFKVENQSKDLKNILKRLKKINYVINCIAITGQEAPIESLIIVNSLFPHFLENQAPIHKFKLIHISSDGVFSRFSGKVNEQSKPIPDNLYGMSKLLGETHSQDALTIRTSILGFNPGINNKGLLEWVIKQKNGTINGYTNQLWAGCTALQFAMLCEWLIFKNKFVKLRNSSSTIHFSPIKSSKYKILKSFSSISKINLKVKKVLGDKITRQLNSNFFDLNDFKMYTVNILKALKELVCFENEIKYKK